MNYCNDSNTNKRVGDNIQNMLEDDDDNIPWIGYNEYTSQLMDDDQLLDYFGIQGPGPPSSDQSWRSNDQQWRSFDLPPPPALPIPSSGGDLNQCLVFSSPLDTCSSFAKVCNNYLKKKDITL